MHCVDKSGLYAEPSTSFSRHSCGRSVVLGPLHTGSGRLGGPRTPQQPCFRPFRDGRSTPTSRHRLQYCQAEGSDRNDRETATQSQLEDRLKQTMAGLDALLGTANKERQEKEKEEAQKLTREEEKRKGLVDLTFSKEVLQQVSKVEAERLSQGKSDEEREKKEQELAEKLTKIIESSRKMSDSQSSGSAGIKQVMDLYETLNSSQSKMSREDQQRLKDKVFGPNLFYVTEIRPLAGLRTIFLNSPSASSQELIQGSILVRGNLRVKVEEVFDSVCTNLRQEFGDTYTAIMVTDPDSEEDDTRGGPRVAFQIASSELIQPQAWGTAQKVLAVVLGVLTVATALQLGLASNVSRLPKVVVDFLAQPDAFKGELPPEIENYDATPYLLSALPISLSVLGIQLAHEIAHKVVASTRNLRLAAPVLLPNFNVGCFGAITQLKSLARNRTDLFDVSAAGPAAGGAISTALFIAGLALTKSATPEELLAVPGALLDGSLLLGTVAHLFLGEAVNATTIAIHPMLIAGWCGAISTALNCLPVGCLDGGRIMMAAYGRNYLGVTSFFMYLGLGLGFLGSGLALPFGLFVLLCQRDPEKNLQDTVTAPNQARQTIAAISIVLAVMVLLPMLPTGSADLGGGGFSL